MKKTLFLLAAALCTVTGAWAQKYMFVNSETVFKSQTDYNEAIKQLDDLANLYQKHIDEAYAELDEMFNNYQAQKDYLSESSRQAREDAIISREKEINKYQQDVLGPEGDLMKKRLELIKPIQERIFTAINNYATANGFDMVIDIANNQTLLYYSPALNKTDELVNMLNQ